MGKIWIYLKETLFCHHLHSYFDYILHSLLLESVIIFLLIFLLIYILFEIYFYYGFFITMVFYIVTLVSVYIYICLVVHSILKKYPSDPLSVIYPLKGLITSMVLKVVSHSWGHSLEGSIRGDLGFLDKFSRFLGPKRLKFSMLS